MTQSVVAVIGATGVYGRHLLPRLAVAGHRARPPVRAPASAKRVTLGRSPRYPSYRIGLAR